MAARPGYEGRAARVLDRLVDPFRRTGGAVLVQDKTRGLAVAIGIETDLGVEDLEEEIALVFREYLETLLPGRLDVQSVIVAGDGEDKIRRQLVAPDIAVVESGIDGGSHPHLWRLGKFRFRVEQMATDVVDAQFGRRVGQDDDTHLGLGQEADERPVAAGATIVPDHLVLAGLGDEPAEAGVLAAADGLALAQGKPESRRQRRALPVHRRLEDGQHVVGARIERAEAGQRRHVPVGRFVERLVVTGRLARLLYRRKRDDGVLQAERRGDAVADQARIIGAGMLCQHMAEQAVAEVGIFEFATDIARQRVAREEAVELVDGVVRIRIATVLGREIIRQARQAGHVGGEIAQGDLAAPALWHGDASGQVFGDGIVERHFALRRHLCQRQRGENLGDGTDLEDGVAVDRARIVGAKAAMRDDAPAVGVDNADDDAEALFFDVDALLKDTVDFRIRRDGGGFFGLGADLRGDREQASEKQTQHFFSCHPSPGGYGDRLLRPQ